MPRICSTTPRDAAGQPLKVRDAASADLFVKSFRQLADGQPDNKKSFTRYMTIHGYSSYSVVKDQPNLGLLKGALAEVSELQQRAASGDPDAINSLMILRDYVTRDQLQKASA